MTLQELNLFIEINKIVRGIDPFNIAWVSDDEYYPEVKDIVKGVIAGENTQKLVKEVFDKWFYEKEENNEKYKEIAKKIELLKSNTN
jgi:hypothetical protein